MFRRALLVLGALTLASRAGAQATSGTDTTTHVVTPSLDFSGVVFGNFSVRGDSAGGGANAFNLDRAYLTFKMPAGARTSIRVTGDVFQQTSAANNGYYKGWVLRAKYAYMQYNFFDKQNPAGFNTLARIGMLHTVVIDHEEGFWPRYITNTAVERNNFFSSADLGVAVNTIMPNKWGEIYVTGTNGNGYTSPETDRFKDYAARVSFTPLASGSTGLFKSLVISPWYYKGAAASAFVNGGAGQVGPVGSALAKDRYGVFAGIKDPRLTIGAEWATKKDDVEGGANTAGNPRTVTSVSGRLIDAFIIAKPFQLMNAKSTTPLGLVFRVDEFKPNSDVDGQQQFVVAGLTWDVSKKAQLAFDYQETTNKNGIQGATPHTYFLHWVANF